MAASAANWRVSRRPRRAISHRSTRNRIVGGIPWFLLSTRRGVLSVSASFTMPRQRARSAGSAQAGRIAQPRRHVGKFACINVRGSKTRQSARLENEILGQGSRGRRVRRPLWPQGWPPRSAPASPDSCGRFGSHSARRGSISAISRSGESSCRQAPQDAFEGSRGEDRVRRCAGFWRRSARVVRRVE